MAVPTLDGLPVELKILILCQAPDAETLKCLIHASPGYHQAYLEARHQVLRCLVKHLYAGSLDLAEALTAIRSKGVRFAKRGERVVYLLDLWRRRNEIRELRQSSSNHHQLQPDEPESLEELIKLVHLHEMLGFFLEDFAINAPRPPWIQPAQWESEILPLRLSQFEQHRFVRGICRLQVIMNMFGDRAQCSRQDGRCSDPDCRCTRWSSDEVIDMTDRNKREEAYQLYYGPMSPWESDEIASVFSYFSSKVKSICCEVADNVRQHCKDLPSGYFCELPKEDRLPWLGGIESVKQLFYLDKEGGNMANLGPDFFYRILRMDPISRRNRILENSCPFWNDPLVGDCLFVDEDLKFPYVDPADRLEAPNFEDFWSTLPPLEQPTVGWKKAWLVPHTPEDNLEDSLNYSRRAGHDLNWCYALWDERRLKQWKAPLIEKDGPFDG